MRGARLAESRSLWSRRPRGDRGAERRRDHGPGALCLRLGTTGPSLRRRPDRTGSCRRIDAQQRAYRRDNSDRHTGAASEFRHSAVDGPSERLACALGGCPEPPPHLAGLAYYLRRGGVVTSWYAVYTQPHAETKAFEHLRRQGYSVYLPRYRTRISHARRRQTVLRPLFPRYLFAGIDGASMRWRPILSTFGVTDLVRT